MCRVLRGFRIPYGYARKAAQAGSARPLAVATASKRPKGEIMIGFYTAQQIEKIKEQLSSGAEPWKSAYQSLINYITKHFNDDFPVDEDFNIPGYYIDAEGHKRGKARLNAVGCMAYACALAYALNGEKLYSQKSIELLKLWAETNKKASGFDGALSMSYIGPSLVFAAELLTLSGGWNDKESEIFKAWLKAVFLPTANSIRERANNWGDWGMLASTATYNYLGETEEVKHCAEMIKGRIENTITEKGDMPHETKREGNGIWYTYFALAPMTAACNIIRNSLGIDLFKHKGENGQCIKLALDYLLYYYQNPEKWPHFDGKQNFTTGKSDWPYNIFEKMGKIYGDEKFTEFSRSHKINEVIGHHYAWTFTTLTTV